MRILSATDLLPKSERAVERAGFLADTLDGELTLLHAVAPMLPDGLTLEERVRHASSRLANRTSPPTWRWRTRPGIAVHCGRPARVVLDGMDRQQAHLVVLGPHHGTPADFVSGTLTEKVLGAAHCPLLIVRQETHGRYRHVLLALDGSPGTAAVVRAFESLHLPNEGPLSVVHAHEPLYAGMMNTVGVGAEATSAYVEASRQQAATHLRTLLNAHSEESRRYRIVIVEQGPATAIMGAVERLSPDLIVLGTRGHGRFRRALLGSVATEVLRATECDVLLVPERTGAPLHG